MDAVATYTATGPDAEASAKTWTLEGDDNSATVMFQKVGMLTFRSSPDYDEPDGRGHGQRLHGNHHEADDGCRTMDTATT